MATIKHSKYSGSGLCSTEVEIKLHVMAYIIHVATQCCSKYYLATCM